MANWFGIKDLNILPYRGKGYTAVVKVEEIYSAPYHPTDMSTTWCIDGLAIGKRRIKELEAAGEIIRITNKNMKEILLKLSERY